MTITPVPNASGSTKITGALSGTEIVDVNVGPVWANCTTQQIANLAGSTGITTLTLDGATSGSTTLTPAAIASGALTVPSVTGTLASTSGSNLFISDIKTCSGTVTSNSTTLANVTGLSFTVVPGTYRIQAVLSGVADGTGGIKYAFNYTTAVLSSLEMSSRGSTAAAVATQHTTTTTTQTLLFDQAAAVLLVTLDGTMVVTTGGTVDIQVAQHAANASSTTVVGSYAEFTRIA